MKNETISWLFFVFQVTLPNNMNIFVEQVIKLAETATDSTT